MNKLFLNIALIATLGITSMHAMESETSFSTKASQYYKSIKKSPWMLASLTSGAIFANQYLNTTRIADTLNTVFGYAQNKHTEKLVAMLPSSIGLQHNPVVQVTLLLGATYAGYKALVWTNKNTILPIISKIKKAWDSKVSASVDNAQNNGKEEENKDDKGNEDTNQTLHKNKDQ